MESAEAIIHFELKYCERCGGLWLRRCDAAAVYCSPCGRQMADIARRRLRRQIPGGMPELAAFTTCLLGWVQPWLEIAGGRCA
jgi:hypothetical protein